MKKIAYILLITGLIPFFMIAVAAKGKFRTLYSTPRLNTFILKGKINGQKDGFLRISYTCSSGKYIQDSCAVKNGAFFFTGKIIEPTMAYCSGKIKSRDFDDPNLGYFFLEPGPMTLEVTANDFKNLKIKGSKMQDELVALQMLKATIEAKVKPISQAYEKVNELYRLAKREKKSEAELEVLAAKAASIRDQFGPYEEQANKIDIEYIKAHPNSYYSAYLLSGKVSSMPLNESRMYYNRMPGKIKQSSFGKDIAKEIKTLETGSAGSVAAEFSAKDINGQQLNLAEFKGKQYVILDFWASWCVPCRKGNPHLLALYAKYKDKGLEIVGVADNDINPQDWKKAVDQDKIGVWKHVLRGLQTTTTGFDASEDISASFGIQSLPTKILIGKDGVIIGRYGGGGEDDQQMDKKLEELFK